MKKSIFMVLGAVALAACQTMSPLQSQLSGKTGTNANSTIAFNEDGTLSGSVTGTWEARGGQFCRTITSPESVAGTACQDAEVDGDQLTITRENGSPVTYTLQ